MIISKTPVFAGVFDQIEIYIFLVDLGGIGPPSEQCECPVLPLNHRPKLTLDYFCKLLHISYQAPSTITTEFVAKYKSNGQTALEK